MEFEILEYIKNNDWCIDGYRAGDLLVAVGSDNTLNISKVKGFMLKTLIVLLDRKGDLRSHHNNSYWYKNRLKFKAQDYIEDINIPTPTELSLISLQFPKINIEEFVENLHCVSQLPLGNYTKIHSAGITPNLHG